MAPPSDKKSLCCTGGIKQVYLTLQLTTPKGNCYSFADRSYNRKAFPLKYEVRPKKTAQG